MIVSLFDLHPTPHLEPSSPPIEILEAGTGHGALTLYLARAIHAANFPFTEEKALMGSINKDEYSSEQSASMNDLMEQLPRDRDLYEPGKNSGSGCRRQAIIHSVDNSPKHQEHAAKIVRGFRRGLYSNDVEFHIGNVSDWVDRQLAVRPCNNFELTETAFLSHVFLDFPSSEEHAEKVASVLHVGGKLVVFCPSITQIVNWEAYIQANKLRLRLSQVLELGPGISGGRQWDVRRVQPRALCPMDKKETVVINAAQTGTDDSQDHLPIFRAGSTEETDAAEPSRGPGYDDYKEWKTVCRPKVGEKLVGGGFVAVWEKQRPRGN